MATGASGGGQKGHWFVALVALVGGLEVLGALALRFLDGRRRRRAGSGYS